MCQRTIPVRTFCSVLLICLAIAAFAIGPAWSQTEVAAEDQPTPNWLLHLRDEVRLFGHRNWIVVADSAYPAQSREAITTIVTNTDHFKVLEEVLAAVEQADHVRPIIHLDKELQYLTEKLAPGITQFRQTLKEALGDRQTKTMPHEDIIERLDEAGEMFRVLILKTDLTLPYTSVFLQLDCGYWSGEDEQKLREFIEDGETAVDAGQEAAEGQVSPSEEQAAERIQWHTDYEQALQEAERQGKPVLIDLTAEWCPPCEALDEHTWPDLEVIRLASSFVCVKVDIDANPAIAEKYQAPPIPRIVFADADGTKFMDLIGYRPPAIMVGNLRDALAQWPNP